jgi:predicted Rossmann-fold nucleotide-binding protein
VPIILVGNDFWKPVQHFISEYMLKKYQAIDEEDMNLYTITEDEDQIAEIIKNMPVRDGIRFNYKETDEHMNPKE